VAERGTHAELLAKNGWYAQMFRKQQLERKLGEELDDGKE
jgi:ATP-binding cassette subfamily B protein/ATP-binding cassette subfamily C protein